MQTNSCCRTHRSRQILILPAISIGMWIGLCVAICVTLEPAEGSDDTPPASSTSGIAGDLSELSVKVWSDDERPPVSMVRDEQRRRLQAVNDRSRKAWNSMENRRSWEAFVDPRIERLSRSMGRPRPGADAGDDADDDEKDAGDAGIGWLVTGETEGSGYVVRNLVFESRPDLWVTANLYRPADEPKNGAQGASERAVRPGILICHSHHRPKEHHELQDMGVTWARKGCVVLVMDQLGHGERRQHPFPAASDFASDFRVSRQDYYFRYDTGIQLHLAGESLVGWMAWDLMRGVDLLCTFPEVDKNRIALLGAVAGGGDPAAVTAALDERIDVAVPFNFGGPQPETRYPLPDDAETSFNYAGSGSWESTRNLRRSAADGFLPWVIVASIAPRKLVFAHEFNWDRPRDPVWRRLKQVYRFYDAPEALDYTHGRGELRGRPPEATHCTHIGRPHRVRIHQAFARWFDIDLDPDDEFSDPLDSDKLRCMTPSAVERVRPKKLVDLLPALAAKRLDRAAKSLDARADTPEKTNRQFRQRWNQVLGVSDQLDKPRVLRRDVARNKSVIVERIVLQSEEGIQVPLLLLKPLAKSQDDRPRPAVIGLAHSGKSGFLQNQSSQIAQLLQQGIAVCLPDTRGTGELSLGSGRGRQNYATSVSSTELMLGRTMVGARLLDVRCVLTYLRSRDDFSSSRIGVWGSSFAPTNSDATRLLVPRRIEARLMPKQSEPLGGFLALLLALYEPESVDAVYLDRGLLDFSSVLTHPMVLVPHDVVVPELLTVSDLPDLAGRLAQPVGARQFVDHRNLPVSKEHTEAAYPEVELDERPADWLSAHLAP